MAVRAIWENNTPYSKFLISVGVILVCAVLFTIISTLVASGIFGLSPMQLHSLVTDFENPMTISVFKVIQSISTIGTFIIPALVLSFLFSSQWKSYLQLDKISNPASLILVFILLVLLLPAINFLGELNNALRFPAWLSTVEQWMRESEDRAAVLTGKFLEMNSITDLVLGLIIIAVLPALGEELLFRGVIQRIFSEWSGSRHAGIWSSAFLFSAMHMQFYGFIPRLLLGALLGYLLIWSASLWLPILAHFFNNAAAVVFTYLYKSGAISINPDEIGTQNESAVIITSFVAGALVLWLIWQNENRLRQAT